MAKIFGQLEKAQLENTTSDTASHPKGMATYRTDINQVKVSNGTVYKTMIDEDSSQNLSNKTLVSPSVTGAVTAQQITTPTNPSAGNTKVYVKSDNKLYTLDSSGNESSIGSGGGGVKNLIINGNADDTASSIFVPYADTASTRPVDGAGGSPTVTTSVTSASPLDGIKSYLLTKPASNVQGQGWAVPFTVDLAYRAKALKISIDYIINSGSFTAGSSSTESNVIWYIYDVTNSQLIEPSNIKMFSNSSTIADKFEATFQTSATGSSYRLIAHVQSTDASAFELKVDNITITPEISAGSGGQVIAARYGTTSTAALPTTVTVVAYSTRYFDSTNSYNTATGVYTVSEAGVYRATHSLVTQNGTAIKTVVSQIRKNSTVQSASTVIREVATGSQVTLKNSALIQCNAGDTIDFTLFQTVAGDSYTGNASDNFIEIEKVQESNQISNSGRVIAAVLNLSSSISANPNNSVFIIPLNSAPIDTSGAINTGTNRFIAQTEGFYRITGKLVIQSPNVIAGAEYYLSLRKNGSEASRGTTYRGIAATGAQIELNCLIYLNSGDFLQLGLFSSANHSVNQLTIYGDNSSVFFSSLQINRLSGPSQIAANETIAVRATNEASTALTNSFVTIPFTSKTFDTTNSFNGATGVFTAPASGIYQIIAQIRTDVAYSAAQSLFVEIRKNGNRISLSNRMGDAAAVISTSSVLINLVAGDTIDVRGYSDVATTLTAGTGVNHVNIIRVGIS